MTQYLLALYRDYAVAISPERSQQVWAGVNSLGDRMTDAGAFVFKGGMQGGPESATVVRQSGGDFLMTDWPYTETKEHLAGFWIINGAGRDEAVEWGNLAAAAEPRQEEVRMMFGGAVDDAIQTNVSEAQ